MATEKYTHIKDCWTELARCYSIQQMRDLLEEFPIWSGDWTLEVDGWDATVTVTNRYYEKETETYQEDKEDYDAFDYEDGDAEIFFAKAEDDDE